MRVDYEPSKWGPAAWNFLHTVAFSYPDDPDEETQSHFRQFFHSLQHTLPCGNCRRHYAESLRAAERKAHTAKDPFKNRDRLCRWLVKIHNQVNTMHSKPTMRYSDVEALYQDETVMCQSPPDTSLAQTGAAEHPAAAPGAARRRAGMTPSLVVLVVFVVVVLLFIAACVVAYTGCACTSSSRSACNRSSQKKWSSI